MSYYHIDGVSGVFASSDVATHQQTKNWRLALALLVVLIGFAASNLAFQVFSAVEQAEVGTAYGVALTSPQPVQPTPLPVVTSEPTPSKLQDDLQAWVSSKKVNGSFYVQSLDTGDVLASIHADKQYQMASIYKLFLLQPLAKKIPAEAWGTTQAHDKTYLACVNAMLAVSDNPCAEAIAQKLGWTNVHKQTRSLGYKNTRLDDAERFNSSAADTGLLLDRLYHGDDYDAKTKNIALEALARKKSTEAVRLECSECTVYNKTGDLNGYKHDAAIVKKQGKAYVVVLFSSGSNWAQLREAAAIITNYL